jgi:hypothetical protein
MKFLEAFPEEEEVLANLVMKMTSLHCPLLFN